MSDDDYATQRDPGRVRAVYDEIAAHFAETRASPWPEVECFLGDTEVADPAVGLDLGCANGRHAELLADLVDTVLAVDVSRGLLAEASERMDRKGWTAALVQGDGARLPIAADTVDVGVYVATLHHLPDRETRIESLDELARVLAPGGRALVSAWSTVHDRFDGDVEPAASAGADTGTGFDTTVDWTLPGGETVERFYHIYAPAEFEADLQRSGLTVEEVFVSSGNCYGSVTE